MKIYRDLGDYQDRRWVPKLECAEIPDGTVLIAIGAVPLDQDATDSGELDPIVAIDFECRKFWRRKRSVPRIALRDHDTITMFDFPERWIGEDEIAALPWITAVTA